MTIKVLIADDHPVVRAGLKQIIADAADMVVADEACNGREVLSKVKAHSYDVVVMDVSMPDGSGLEALKQLKAGGSDLPVLMLSIHPEEQYAIRTLKAGASGYLTKDSVPDELAKAIRIVSQGRKYVSTTLAERMASDLAGKSANLPHETLSDRELEVMHMLAEGKTPTQISQHLCLSVKTISTYRSRVLEKMKMNSNAELARYALENGLLG